jgi:hypothetical protein
LEMRSEPHYIRLERRNIPTFRLVEDRVQYGTHFKMSTHFNIGSLEGNRSYQNDIFNNSSAGS